MFIPQGLHVALGDPYSNSRLGTLNCVLILHFLCLLQSVCIWAFASPINLGFIFGLDVIIVVPDEVDNCIQLRVFYENTTLPPGFALVSLTFIQSTYIMDLGVRVKPQIAGGNAGRGGALLDIHPVHLLASAFSSVFLLEWWFIGSLSPLGLIIESPRMPGCWVLLLGEISRSLWCYFFPIVCASCLRNQGCLGLAMRVYWSMMLRAISWKLL